MYKTLKDEMKKTIVKAIHDGLLATRDDLYSNPTITTNRKHMAKWDNINESVVNTLDYNDDFIIVPLDRGIFSLIMIFDGVNKVLYTIMKGKNLEALLKRNDIENPHYIDAMLDCNLHLQEKPSQICFEGFEDTVLEDKVQSLKRSILALLGTEDIIKYTTIVIDFSGYSLNSIESITCSKFLNVLDRENWSEYIVNTYDDVMAKNDIKVNEENDLAEKIKIKKSKSNSNIDIAIKTESKVV